jgi:hypothetical protein
VTRRLPDAEQERREPAKRDHQRCQCEEESRSLDFHSLPRHLVENGEFYWVKPEYWKRFAGIQ